MDFLPSAVIWTFALFAVVDGHGMLWEPPGRSTMWRRGFNTPINPNDNELNCGGFENQWIKNGGRCGLCGDPFQQNPRQNEAGGKYATGTVSRKYRTGNVIKLQADLTANHKGFMEYHLCPLNNSNEPITEECFRKHPIKIVGSMHGKYMVGGRENGIITMEGKLPDEISCTHCVLQWHYKAGNRWNCDNNNFCGKGRGPQEEFFGCADVQILPDGVTEVPQRIPTNEKFSVIRGDKLDYPVNENHSMKRGQTPSRVDMRSNFRKDEPVTRYRELRPAVDSPKILLNPNPVMDKRRLDHYTRQILLNNLTRKEQNSIPQIMEDAVSIARTKSQKENYKIFRERLDATLKNSGKKSAILDELSDVLWSLLKAVMQVSDKETGRHVSLVKMSPVGDFSQISDLAKSLSKQQSFIKWPPEAPTIIEANIDMGKHKELEPIMLSEVTALQDIKSKTQNDLLVGTEMNKGHIKEKGGIRKATRNATQLQCQGTRHHRYVKGISDWCTSNCRQGNCPGDMCECKEVRAHVASEQDKNRNNKQSVLHKQRQNQSVTYKTSTMQDNKPPHVQSSRLGSMSLQKALESVQVQNTNKRNHGFSKRQPNRMKKVQQSPPRHAEDVNRPMNIRADIDPTLEYRNIRDEMKNKREEPIRKKNKASTFRSVERVSERYRNVDYSWNEQTTKSERRKTKRNRDKHERDRNRNLLEPRRTKQNQHHPNPRSLQTRKSAPYSNKYHPTRSFLQSDRRNTKRKGNKFDSNHIPQITKDKVNNEDNYSTAGESMICDGIGEFARRNKMTNWCFENCSKGFCPKSLCKCSFV